MVLRPLGWRTPDSSTVCRSLIHSNLRSAFCPTTLSLLLHAVSSCMCFKYQLRCDSPTPLPPGPCGILLLLPEAHIILFGYCLFPHHTESWGIGNGSILFTTISSVSSLVPGIHVVSTQHIFVERSNDVPAALLEKHHPSNLSIPLLSCLPAPEDGCRC